VVGLRCLPRIQAGPRLLTRTAGPVALCSPTGSIVRPDHRFLWPHLRLCRPPAGLWIIPSGCEPVPASRRGSPIYSVSPSDHAVARTPVAPTTACNDAFAAGSAFAPSSWARQPQFPHQSGTNGVALSKLQHSLYATAWSFARPAPVRTFTTELAWAGSPLSPKSVISRWFIVIFHRRTRTGWTISIMGCETKCATKCATKSRKSELLGQALARTRSLMACGGGSTAGQGWLRLQAAHRQWASRGTPSGQSSLDTMRACWPWRKGVGSGP
jgi:hypothetical protein